MANVTESYKEVILEKALTSLIHRHYEIPEEREEDLREFVVDGGFWDDDWVFDDGTGFTGEKEVDLEKMKREIRSEYREMVEIEDEDASYHDDDFPEDDEDDNSYSEPVNPEKDIEDVVNGLHVGFNYVPGIGYGYCSNEQDLQRMKDFVRGGMAVNQMFKMMF